MTYRRSRRSKRLNKLWVILALIVGFAGGIWTNESYERTDAFGLNAETAHAFVDTASEFLGSVSLSGQPQSVEAARSELSQLENRTSKLTEAFNDKIELDTLGGWGALNPQVRDKAIADACGFWRKVKPSYERMIVLLNFIEEQEPGGDPAIVRVVEDGESRFMGPSEIVRMIEDADIELSVYC